MGTEKHRAGLQPPIPRNPSQKPTSRILTWLIFISLVFLACNSTFGIYKSRFVTIHQSKLETFLLFSGFCVDLFLILLSVLGGVLDDKKSLAVVLKTSFILRATALITPQDLPAAVPIWGLAALLTAVAGFYVLLFKDKTAAAQKPTPRTLTWVMVISLVFLAYNSSFGIYKSRFVTIHQSKLETFLLFSGFCVDLFLILVSVLGVLDDKKSMAVVLKTSFILRATALITPQDLPPAVPIWGLAALLTAVAGFYILLFKDKTAAAPSPVPPYAEC